MFILTLTQAEANAALIALGGFMDNEHDKGCDESPMVEAAEQAATLLGKATSVDLTLLQVTTLMYACESQSDVSDDGADDEYAAQCNAMRAVTTVIEQLFTK